MSSQKPEDSWFEDGAPVDEDFVDPELLKLARRPSILELLLFLVIMVFGIFVAITLRFDLTYYFADSEPIEVGQVEDLAVHLAEDPDYLLSIGSNVYVHLEGIPSRRSETKNDQYAQLVGAPIFVQQTHELADVDPLIREAQPAYGPHDDRHTRYYINTNGRFRHFDDLGSRQSGLIEFYTRGYGIWFCGEELTPEQLQFQRNLREETISTLQEELGRDPEQSEIDEVMDQAFHCQYGFLFEADKAPADYTWALITFIFLGVVELGCLFFVFRWIRRYTTA